MPPVLALMAAVPVMAERVYRHTLTPPEPQVRRGHLDLGGAAPDGRRIEVNSHYIEWGGEPFVPVIGEFHYSRYPAEQWEESLRKMKAGGINVVGTYVFWNLHERRPGDFDWSGNLDLRRFISLCRANGLAAIVRLGPFCHGEIRNGGLPDWLYGQPYEVRSNDPRYLAQVDALYAAIAGQLRGELFADGGPVIGVQLENEYQHSAAPWEWGYPGTVKEYTVAARDQAVTHHQVSASEVENRHAAEGAAHMRALKDLARRHGLDVPLYTATGWGNAAIVPHGSVPVTAGYPFPFWAPPRPSPLYLYTDLRRKPDYSPVSYDPELYPSLPAELGAGIMVTHGRRPIVPPESVAPMMVRTLGSGSNGIGYYMYHGGSTPVFDGYYHEASGGLPRINYDFQAPIGEFGQLREHYRSLKLIHLFLHAYGARLAPMPTQLPATNAALAPEDVQTLRYAIRTDGTAGFVFMHNYQDHVATSDLPGLQIQLKTTTGEVAFPATGTFTLRHAASAILPFNLPLGDVTLRSATVQPLTVLRRREGPHHVFVAIEGLEPELVFDAGTEIETVSGECRVEEVGAARVVRGRADAAFAFTAGGQRCLVVPRAVALNVVRTNDEQLVFAEADLIPGPEGIQVVARGRDRVDLTVYPEVDDLPALRGGRLSRLGGGTFGSTYRLQFEPVAPAVVLERVGARKVRLRAPTGIDGLHDVRVRLHYRGDRALAFIGGELVGDHFYYGQPWELGLRKFVDALRRDDMVVVFHPIHRSYGYLGDLPAAVRPEFTPGTDEVLSIDDFEVLPDYQGLLVLRGAGR